MTHPRFIGGALLAAVTAGPVLTLQMLLSAGVVSGTVNWDVIGALPLIVLLSALVGFVVALLPSVGAAAGLAWLGRRHRWARHPLVWAAAGVLVGSAVGLALTISNDVEARSRILVGAIIGFGVPGAACALLARRRTRWPD